MSVMCFIDYRDGKKRRIPVAGEGTFDALWAETASELGLKHIPLLSNGFFIDDQATLLEIIEELPVLGNHWQEWLEHHSSWKIEGVVERIDKLMLALQEAVNDWDEIDHIVFW